MLVLLGKHQYVLECLFALSVKQPSIVTPVFILASFDRITRRFPNVSFLFCFTITVTQRSAVAMVYTSSLQVTFVH